MAGIPGMGRNKPDIPCPGKFFIYKAQFVFSPDSKVPFLHGNDETARLFKDLCG
jgi:hypothetical protein